MLVYFQKTCHSANYRFCVCHVFLFRILFLWILCFLKLRLMQRYSRNVLSQVLLLIKLNQIAKFFIFTSTSWSRYQRKKFTQGISVSLLWGVSFPNYSLVYSCDPGPCNSTEMWPVLSECCTDGVLSLLN